MQEIISTYRNDPEVAVLTIQTTFEGFSINSAQALQEIKDQYQLTIPIGHNGWQGTPSPLLRRYRAQGTPWVVVIDKNGVVRFNNFYLRPSKARNIIERLRKEE